MAKGADKKSKGGADAKGKKDKGKKDKKGKKGASTEEQSGRPLSVAAHPTAKSHVRRAKGFGGLIGFALAAVLSLQAAVPMVDVGERALIAGLAGYMLGWACSVTIWRQIMLAELKVAAEQITKRRSEPSDD